MSANERIRDVAERILATHDSWVQDNDSQYPYTVLDLISKDLRAAVTAAIIAEKEARQCPPTPS